MDSLPSLPPLLYRLWLPHVALYVREIDWLNDRFIGTPDPKRATVLPETQARQLAIQLGRARGFVVELRSTGEAAR